MKEFWENSVNHKAFFITLGIVVWFVLLTMFDIVGKFTVILLSISMGLLGCLLVYCLVLMFVGELD